MEKPSKINTFDNEQLVIYDSNINAQIVGLHKKDYDLFMTCAYKLKDMSNQTIEVGYRELMNTGHFERLNLQQFHHYLNDETKIDDIKLEVIEEDGEEVNKRRIPLFKDFHPKWRNRKLELTVNDVFMNYFSQLTGYFTELDLVIYTSLKSKYSKILYQNLCQFRGKNGKGWWDIPLEDNVRENQPVGFMTLFEVPQKAREQKRRIMDDIIKPSMVELAPYMAIEVTPVYGTGRGKPLIGYHFDFKTVQTMAIEEKKPVVREMTEEEKTEYNAITEGAEQMTLEECLEDTLFDLIDKSGLGLGSRSANTIVKSCIKNGRDAQFLSDAIAYVKEQGANNVGAKLNYFCTQGYDKPTKKAKKNSFNNFEQRNYDYEELERMLTVKKGVEKW